MFFYGDAKTGKTTCASRFDKALLLGFEKGWNAIPGVMAQPINSWGEFKKVLKQLKDDKVKEMFSTVIVDTVDLAYDFCEKYICANSGVDSIAEIGFGKGFTMAAKEFDDALRSIVQMNYGLVMISHAQDKTFTNEQGQEYNKIVPTLGNKPRNIVERMSDIIGYARTVTDENGNLQTRLFMRGTTRFDAGSRFRYTPDSIEFTYQNLVNAINTAIDKQAEEDGAQFFTDKQQTFYQDPVQDLDFDKLMSDFNSLIATQVEKVSEEEFETYWQPRIVQITNKYLGKGMKVNQCSRDQVEALDLIVTDLKELFSTPKK